LWGICRLSGKLLTSPGLHPIESVPETPTTSTGRDASLKTVSLHVPSAGRGDSLGPFSISTLFIRCCLSNGPKYSTPIGNRPHFETACHHPHSCWWPATAVMLDTPAVSPAICCIITANFSCGEGALIQKMNGRNGANITPSLLLLYSVLVLPVDTGNCRSL
jgi:hypothetical protein